MPLLRRLVLWLMLAVAIVQPATAVHLHPAEGVAAAAATAALAQSGDAAGESSREGEAPECRCPWCSPSLHLAVAGDTPRFATPRAALRWLPQRAPAPRTPPARTLPPSRGPPAVPA